MNCENKIQEYIDSLENDKLLIETHFANMEKVTRENEKLILLIFNTTSYAMI